MARRRRSAGNTFTATDQVLRQLLSPHAILSRHSYSLPGDRRYYDPSFHQNAPSVSGHRHHRLVIHDPNVNRASRSRARGRTIGLYTPPVRIAFAEPKRVSVCVRRKVRREVLFASGGAAKGARQRNRRRNWTSDITC